MEYLIDFFQSISKNPAQASWMFAATIGLAFFLFAAGAIYLGVGLFGPMQRRMRVFAGVGGETSGDTISRAMAPVAQYVLPKKAAELSATGAKLAQAGYRSENATAVFYAIKLLAGLLFPTAVVFGATFFPKLTTPQVVMAALAASFAGMLLPGMVLSRKIDKRKRAITRAFPDALDLLVACTEAGMGLNAALQRVANEIAVSYPPLAEELALVIAQMRAGVDRVQALKELAERTGLDEIRGLVSSLAQSMRFGTSIADALRVYSDEFRDKRMQRAEEMAAKIGTKMIFPLVFCMFPAFFVVAVGPAVIGVVRVLQGL